MKNNDLKLMKKPMEYSFLCGTLGACRSKERDHSTNSYF